VHLSIFGKDYRKPSQVESRSSLAAIFTLGRFKQFASISQVQDRLGIYD
jgi:hypothetical protein